MALPNVSGIYQSNEEQNKKAKEDSILLSLSLWPTVELSYQSALALELRS